MHRFSVTLLLASLALVAANACSSNDAKSFVGLSDKSSTGQASNAPRFERTYTLAAGGSISVANVSGDTEVKGYDGDKIIIVGIKQGRDADKIDVEDRSTEREINVRADYNRCRMNCNASVRFEVQVPRNVRYTFNKITTASGDLIVTNVTGDVTATTASGDVRVEGVTGNVQAETASGDVEVINITGAANAKTASGDVEVAITRLEGAGDLKFSSASGDVDVQLPASLDADVELSTISGDVRTDFPLEVTKPQYGPGAKASGRLGNGTRRVEISTVSGDVKLARG